jgi:hypothetical protein
VIKAPPMETTTSPGRRIPTEGPPGRTEVTTGSVLKSQVVTPSFVLVLQFSHRVPAIPMSARQRGGLPFTETWAVRLGAPATSAATANTILLWCFMLESSM